MWEQGNAECENDKRFYLAAALFIVNYFKRGMTPSTIPDALNNADRFLKEYSGA